MTIPEHLVAQRESRRGLLVVVLAATLGLANCSSKSPGSTGCEANRDCKAGEVCLGSDCAQVCRVTSDCRTQCATCVCRGGACQPGGQSGSAPVIDRIDAEGSVDPDPTHVGHRTDGTMLVSGSALSGAEVYLTDGTNRIDLEVCNDTESELTVLLPPTLAAGNYGLTVANQAGTCSGSLGLLKGEDGAPGTPGVQGPMGVAGPMPIITPGAGLIGDGSSASPLAIDAGALSPLILGNVGCPSGQLLQGFSSSGAPICNVASTNLGGRVQSVSRRGIGSIGYYDWSVVPGMILPFVAAGGPVLVNLSIPLLGGSTTACRSTIDGYPAVALLGGDTTYIWQEGLTYTNNQWVMWNNSRLYPGVLAGAHTLGVQCREDSTTASTAVGNAQMTITASVIPFGPAATDSTKAYVVGAPGGQNIATGGYVTITGLTLTATTTGGPVRIGISLPLNGGSHSSCRPLVDGIPAGTGDIDNTTYIWEEGLTLTAPGTNGGWTLWNRNRIYTGLSAGSHNFTVACVTDAATVSIGNGSMTGVLSVIAYPDPSVPSNSPKAYKATKRGPDSLPVGSNWVDISSLSAAFTASGGPVEVGVSMPLNSGSHTTCRALIDGSPITAGEPDDFNYIWHEGLNYSFDGWAQWDRIRVYRNIPAGAHTLTAQCRNDGATATAGHVDMVSTVWAVAY